jgi:hypothetical protein
MSFLTENSGSFELTSVKNLPNAQVAHPGEHWSNRKASGAIVPGAAVVPLASGSAPDATMVMRLAKSGDAVNQLAVALRTVQVPDPNKGPGSLGPTEIMNQTIASGEYIHAHYTGVLRLTLIVPDTYTPGELIGWKEAATMSEGKLGKGAWSKDASADVKSVFEVIEWEEVNKTTHEGILTVRFLRGGGDG